MIRTISRPSTARCTLSMYVAFLLSEPVNYRVYDKAEGKTKNDHFQDMLTEVLAWGLEPSWVTGDSWYSGVNTLKRIRHHRLGFLFALESNRLVSLAKGTWSQVQSLEIPRHYAVYPPDPAAQPATVDRPAFVRLHDQHWQIEPYHRVLKQVCHIEHGRVRSLQAIRNHI